MSQSNLDLTSDKKTRPVECLGQTFESDEARRAHYTELLREKLKDPEFRKIEGFPIHEKRHVRPAALCWHNKESVGARV
ncbi:MAG TPA: hypothetical protein VJ952_12135 [Opitutales bacterium]|nr:hypothetical protein [Opitutales bacterium]